MSDAMDFCEWRYALGVNSISFPLSAQAQCKDRSPNDTVAWVFSRVSTESPCSSFRSSASLLAR